MNTSEVAWKSFLETTPPNTPVTISGLAVSHVPPHANRSIWKIVNPYIELHCEHDDGVRRFDPTTSSYVFLARPITPSYEFIAYLCRDCQSSTKTFAVLIQNDESAFGDPAFEDPGSVEVMKLGEYPPFSAPISSRIQKLLSDSDLELYRKGVRAEAQGLGIGAATYFRRIVDEQWQRLVKEIRQAAEQLGVEDLGVYDAAMGETQFSKAVAMLKDAIPEKLLILQGENPLTLLYKPLSQQLHGMTDEECLQQAADIRLVLTVLLENIAEVMKDQDELTAAAKRLKEK